MAATILSKRWRRALLLGALTAVACDFGASKFKVVDATSGDGDSAGEGGSTSNGDGDGDSSTSSSGDGDGLGGGSSSGNGDGDGDGDSTTGDGSGGSEAAPSYTCSKQGVPDLVLSKDELSEVTWADVEGPAVVQIGSNRLGVIMEFGREEGIDEERIYYSEYYYRSVSDSGGGSVESLQRFSAKDVSLRGMTGAHFRADESDSDNGAVIFYAQSEDRIAEVAVPVQGKDFTDEPFEVLQVIDPPADCQGTDSNFGRLRQISVDVVDGVTTLGIACARQDNTYRSYIQKQGSDPVEFVALHDWTSETTDVLQSIHVLKDKNVMIRTGDEFGFSGIRLSPDGFTDELGQTEALVLDAERISAIETLTLDDQSGIFIMGIAATGPEDEGSEQPQIIPADIYGGSVQTDELSSLTQSVPPQQLMHQGAISSVKELYPFQQLAQVGSSIYYGGENFFSRDSVAISMLKLDGTRLVENFLVAEEEGSEMAHFGMGSMSIGLYVFYSKLDSNSQQLYGQAVFCGRED